jgi:hypothetical protein
MEELSGAQHDGSKKKVRLYRKGGDTQVGTH